MAHLNCPNVVHRAGQMVPVSRGYRDSYQSSAWSYADKKCMGATGLHLVLAEGFCSKTGATDTGVNNYSMP